MKLVSPEPKEPGKQTGSIETVVIPQSHLDYLGRVSREMNPEMPLAFGTAHLVRTLLERLEEAGIEGTAATAAGLRRR